MNSAEVPAREMVLPSLWPWPKHWLRVRYVRPFRLNERLTAGSHLQALVWFVTHFRDLAEILAERNGVVNLHLAVEVSLRSPR